MKNTFSTLAEVQGKLTDSQIVAIVNRYLETRAKQREYHKRYNAVKTAAIGKMRELTALAESKGIELEDLLADMKAGV